MSGGRPARPGRMSRNLPGPSTGRPHQCPHCTRSFAHVLQLGAHCSLHHSEARAAHMEEAPEDRGDSGMRSEVLIQPTHAHFPL